MRNTQKNREWQKRWYSKNKEVQCLKTNLNIARLNELLQEYKKTLACCKCGFANPLCIDFHHVDRSQKENDIPKMIRRGTRWETILGEISKCVPLCANCHRIFHATFGFLIQSVTPEMLDWLNLKKIPEAISVEPKEKTIRLCRECNCKINTTINSQKYCSNACRQNSLQKHYTRRRLEASKKTYTPNLNLRKVERPSFESLCAEYQETKSLRKMGIAHGVSDNSIRKWFLCYLHERQDSRTVREFLESLR